MTGRLLLEAMPRPRGFVAATLTVTGLAVPPAHGERGERWWHVRYSDGRERVMSERTLGQAHLFTPIPAKWL